ncbi:MAG: EAL domain-containing protein, partial [Arcobacteraceae bacterium]
ADLALQAAKKNHKNYIVFYDELDNLQEYENNMTWTKKLKVAIADDKIVVYFQPIVDNKTRRVVKYECLVRMIDDNKIISPYFFLEVAKKTNQYTKMTKIIVEKAFKAFEYLSFDFSINISYDDIEQEWFLDFIKSMIKKYNTHDIAKRVVFEILEDQSIKNYDVLKHFINEVKALGCKIAIDDFGSGYSNFEHIIKMNVDYLKIDASLIKNIAHDENSKKVTQTIVDFAKKLNLKTIAEYVENEEIFNETKSMGVNFSQGYYFSPPVSSPKIESC